MKRLATILLIGMLAAGCAAMEPKPVEVDPKPAVTDPIQVEQLGALVTIINRLREIATQYQYMILLECSKYPDLINCRGMVETYKEGMRRQLR